MRLELESDGKQGAQKAKGGGKHIKTLLRIMEGKKVHIKTYFSVYTNAISFHEVLTGPAHEEADFCN